MNPRPRESSEEHDPSLCNCGPGWRKPKPSGICASCGGWLPGEKPPSLTAMWSDVKRAAEQRKRWDMEQEADDR